MCRRLPTGSVDNVPAAAGERRDQDGALDSDETPRCQLNLIHQSKLLKAFTACRCLRLPSKNSSTIPLDLIGMRHVQLLKQVGWSYRAFLEATPGIGSLMGPAPGAAFSNGDGGHYAGAAAHLRRAAAADATAMDGDALVLGGVFHRYQVPSSALGMSARRHFPRTAP